MAQLIVRNLDERIVLKLRETAARLGLSVEETHRRLLRQSLLGESSSPVSFKDYLRSMPNVAQDSLFERKRTRGRRNVEL